MADWHPFIEVAGLDQVEYRSLVPIYEEARRARPEDVETLAWLGHAYTKLGRFADGLEVDRRLTALLPDDATVRYNLACSLALLDRRDEAFEALAESIRLGYRDGGHMRDDEDLATLRGDTRFEMLLRQVEER